MIDFDSSYDDGELIWFVGKNDNILYSMDRNYCIEPVVLIPYKKDGFRENPRCIKCEDKMICLPDKGDCIIVYDLISRCFGYIDVSINVRTSILNAHVYNGMLWCVSFCSGEVLKCNLVSCRVEARFKFLKNGEHNFNGETKIVGNELYIVNKSGNQYYVFNCDTEEYDCINVACCENGFSTIAVTDKFVYLTGFGNAIYCCNSLGCSTISLDGKMSWLKVNKDAFCPRFHQSFVCGKYIVFTALNSKDFLTDELVVLNTDNNVIYTYLLNEKLQRRIDSNIIVCFTDEECICVHDEMLNNLAYIDLNKRSVSVREVVKKQQTEFELVDGFVYRESFGLELTDYLRAIISKDKGNK